jgi:hypothetical protein
VVSFPQVSPPNLCIHLSNIYINVLLSTNEVSVTPEPTCGCVMMKPTVMSTQIPCLVSYQNGDDGKKENWCVREMSYCRFLCLLQDDLKQKTNSPVMLLLVLHHDCRNVRCLIPLFIYHLYFVSRQAHRVFQSKV